MADIPHRLFLIVLDSVGIGAAPDAAAYGDEGSATLQHIASTVGGLDLPVLTSLGLGNIPSLLPDTEDILGIPPVADPKASFAAMQEVSVGKDTITGHWEIAGLLLQPGFHLFPDTHPSFPETLIDPFVLQTGRPVIGNKHGSGTAIVAELGEQALREGAFIVYTSADSVFQIAAHTDVISLEELYAACEVARTLCDPLRVGRVIARPFTGEPGDFVRTSDRKDYAYHTTEPTLLERLFDHGVPVYSVGKIEDIFAHRGITDGWHTSGNADSQARMDLLVDELDEGFVFANYIDFDMHFGHRRDPEGYAECLRQTDAWLGEFIPRMKEGDVLVITADHGNDPTFKGTDHTREYVPVLWVEPGKAAQSFGLRHGFFDLAQTISHRFGLAAGKRGSSFFT